MSYQKNIANSFITQIVRVLLMLFVSIVISRGLGTVGKGQITYLMLIFGFLAAYGHFGIANANLFFLKKSEFNDTEVYQVNSTFFLIVSALITLVLIALKSYNLIFLDYSLITVIFGALYVLASLLNDCNKNVLVGNGKIINLNQILIIEIIIELTAVLVLIYFDLLNATVYLLIKMALLFITYLVMNKNISHKFRFSFNIKLLTAEFKFGIIIFFSSLFIFLNYRTDQFLINNYIGADQLGIYSIGVMFAEMIYLIPISIQSSLDSKLYNLTDNHSERKKVLTITIKYTFYICLFISLISMLLTPLIHIVYGESFAKAESVTVIMLIGVVFASIAKVSASYFVTLGKPQVHLTMTTISFVANLLLNLNFIPKFGIMGAALASCISNSLYGFLYIGCLVKKERFELFDFFKVSDYDVQLLKNSITKLKYKKKNV